jgi:hypothetical protein
MLHGVNVKRQHLPPALPCLNTCIQHVSNPLFLVFCDGWSVKTAPRCESNSATRHTLGFQLHPCHIKHVHRVQNSRKKKIYINS